MLHLPRAGRPAVRAAVWLVGCAVVVGLLPAVTVSPAAAATPTFASVRPEAASVTLTPTADPAATSYLVCLRRTTRDTTCLQQRRTTSAVAVTFTGLTRAAAGSAYDYVARVTVTRRSGPAATSTNRAVVLAAPPAVASVSTTATTATVTPRSYTGATSYLVCLRRTTTDGSCAQQRTVSTPGAVTFEGLTDAGAGAAYDYVARVTVTPRTGPTATSTNRVVNLATAPPARVAGIAATTTPSTATISWDRAVGATSYDICVRRDRTDAGCDRRSAESAATSVRLTSLTAEAGTDYEYVVRAFGPGGRTNSAWQRLELPVATATAPSIVATRTTEVDLRWEPVWSAVRYRVEVSRSATMSSPQRVETTTPSATLRDLVPGTRYWVRVVGLNDDVAGRASGTASRTLPTDPSRLRIITYNLCGQDKCRAGNPRVLSWGNRKPYAGRLARSTGAGVISTQESGDKDTAFITELPGFRRARYLSGKSLFYSTALFEARRSGDIVLDAGRKRYAVWVELVDRTTRTPVLVVDPHLEPYKGRTNDLVRQAQTRRLISEIERVNTNDVPVVIAGDFNSNKDNADQDRYPGGFDAPASALMEVGYLDARVNALAGGIAANERWNSANQAKNPPLKYGDHIDQVWTSPDVLVRDWAVVLDLDPDDRTRYRTPFASDHNPVRTTLTVPGRPAGP